MRMLERLAAGGDVAAEASLLGERVRAGQLAPERLRLAAYLGQPAARLARPDEDLADPGLRRLPEFGREPVVRAAVAVARCAGSYQLPGGPSFQILTAGLRTVERWLEADPDQRQQKRWALERFVERGTYYTARGVEASGRAFAWAALSAAEATYREDLEAVWEPVAGRCTPLPRPLLELAREALAPWALAASGTAGAR